MRTLGWAVAIILTLGVLAAAGYWVLLPLRKSPAALTFGDRLNVVVTAMALVALAATGWGLYIALASYQFTVDASKDATAAADAQGKILDAQRNALDASRDALQQMVATSNKSRAALESQLALLTEQRKEELARLNRKPRIEVALGDITWEQIKAHRMAVVAMPESRVLEAAFLVRNVGDAILQEPTVLLSAEPRSVTIAPSQFSGLGVSPLVPSSLSKNPYKFEARINVPPDVSQFTIRFAIFGTNLERMDVAIPLQVVVTPPKTDGK